MRINQETVLVGQDVVLVPYRKEHVPQYHTWMQSTELQEQTASEPLSLEEEYDMQAKWHLDEDKLTFIVLCKQGQDGEVDETVEELLKRCKMAGDVNVFFSQDDGDEDDEDGDAGGKTAAATAPQTRGELEVMIAEPTLRRRGLASQALELLLHYIAHEQPPTQRQLLTPSNLFVKIGLANTSSRALFGRLGFKEVSVSEVWQEVEMRYTGDGEHVGQEPQRVLRWPLG